MTDAYLILLFDIYGTLVSTGGAGAVAWKRAFEELYGVPADSYYTEPGAFSIRHLDLARDVLTHTPGAGQLTVDPSAK